MRNLTMMTDLYQLTMMYGYYRHGMAGNTAVFDLFYRKNFQDSAFAVMAGTQSLIEYINGLCFTDDDIEYLRGLNLFVKRGEIFSHHQNSARDAVAGCGRARSRGGAAAGVCGNGLFPHRVPPRDGHDAPSICDSVPHAVCRRPAEPRTEQSGGRGSVQLQRYEHFYPCFPQILWSYAAEVPAGDAAAVKKKWGGGHFVLWPKRALFFCVKLKK